MTFWECAKKLGKRENWTDELTYVHKTRLIIGFILGFVIGAMLL